MKDGLYHKEIGLPADAPKAFIGTWRPKYTRHAQLEAIKDRNGIIRPLRTLTVSLSEIIEVEIFQGQPIKAVVRVPYDKTNDIVLAICRPSDGVATVKTQWLNNRNDTHKTLRREAYVS